jgi:phage replication-related protein YjqB (UPF0714/DUF867 family)
VAASIRIGHDPSSVLRVFARLLRCDGVEERLRLASGVGFLALHGGLEPGTEGVAQRAAALSGASSYVVTQPRTLGWHVPSHRIQPGDSVLLDDFLGHVEVVVSVHGYFRPEWPDAVYVGGANRDLAALLAARLRCAVPELSVVDDLMAIPRALRGVDPRNPVNGTRGGGVQLELPHVARLAGGGTNGDAPARRLTDALSSFAVELAA